MDYVLGNVAALLSGNVTPNRPKLSKRALTPIKQMPSPNVTPKSEFVDDRSIFLSPTMQKKKAIVKKSPKRIFQNSDLDVTAEKEDMSSVTSPKADKVKKHLKKELEANTSLDKSVEAVPTPKSKSSKSIPSPLPNKNVENSDPNSSAKENVNALELTPKRKKKNKNNMNNSENSGAAGEAVESEGTPSKKKQKKNSVSEVTHGNIGNTLDVSASVAAVSPKKNKAGEKNSKTAKAEVNEKPSNNIVAENNTNVTESPKKKKKRRNKSKNKQTQINGENNTQVVKPDASKQSADENVSKDNKSDTLSPKKKNRKRNKSKNKQQQKTEENPVEETPVKPIEKSTDDDKESKVNETTANKKKNRKRKKSTNEQPQEETNDQVETESSPKKNKKIKVNPNAITDKDSDSEHESDDEIESENEESNREVFEESGPVPDASSDEEETPEPKKKEKVEENTETEKPKHVNTAEEIKRTLFVGNVPFSKKCKKEIKKIFSKYGEIESVRIRTVPVKDPSVTPKLAVIKQELHPERSTVNVYVKFNNPNCVEAALAENNTILNNNHLRVTRSNSTGAEHDPHCSVFVGNVPFGLEDEGLREKFDKCGEIESVRIVRDKKTNAGKGFGYVNFKSKDGVELALALTEEDLTIKNRIMRVKRCTLATKMQANQRGRFQGGPNRGPPNRNGPPSRNGPPNRNGPQNRFGPPNRNGPQNRNGPPNRNGPQNRNGPPNRNGPRQGFQGKIKVSQGNRQRGLQDNQSGNQGRGFGRPEGEGQKDGAYRRVMNKRKSQEGGEGPPSKVPRDGDQPREKKAKKEFVGMTAEKKKKKKFDKGQKKKKALSEILTQ